MMRAATYMEKIYADGANGSGWIDSGNVAGNHAESYARTPLVVSGQSSFKTLMIGDMIYDGNAYSMLYNSSPSVPSQVEVVSLIDWPYPFTAGPIKNLGILLSVIMQNGDGEEVSPLRIGWTPSTLAALDDAAQFAGVDLELCHDANGELRIHRASLNWN